MSSPIFRVPILGLGWPTADDSSPSPTKKIRGDALVCDMGMGNLAGNQGRRPGFLSGGIESSAGWPTYPKIP